MAAGCAQTQPAAFVDLGTVLSAEKLPREPVVAVPDVPTGMAPASLILPPLPSRTIDLGSTDERLSQVQQLIEDNRRDALREITRQLRRTFLAEVDRLELEKLAELDPANAERFSALMDTIRREFEAYSQRRWPPLVELSLIAGYPDPDPESQAPVADDPNARKRAARARELRAQLVEIESNFNNRVQALIDANDQFSASEITRIKVDMEEMRATAEERARQEAAKQVELEQENLNSIFESGARIQLPSQPAKAVTIEGAPPAVPPPAVEVPGEKELKNRLRMAIETDVQIWAGMNGYRLVSSKSAGKDRTAEFMEWRKRNAVGP